MQPLTRIFRNILKAKQDKPQTVAGYFGKSDGTVKVSDRPNYVYVRFDTGGEEYVEAYNKSLPPVLDLPVYLGYDIYERRYQVLGWRSLARYGEDDLTAGWLEHHAQAHRYFGAGPGGGEDVLWVEGQQILPGRITPSALMVVVYRWVGYINGTLIEIAQTTVDLSASVPATSGKALFVLLSINTSGTIVTTVGSEVDIASLALSDVPAVPASTALVLGAVRLYNGQTSIVESRLVSDIVDARWLLPWHSHDAASAPGDGLTEAEHAALGNSSPHHAPVTLAAGSPGTLTGQELDFTHDHDGDYLPYRLDNLNASAAPTANDDSADGYSVGSCWIDTTNDKAYVCLDATEGAAVWTETTGAGSGGASALDDLTDVTITSPSDGQVLKRSGGAWVNGTDATGAGGSGSPGYQTLTDGANIAWDLSSGNAQVTLGGNRTLDNPTNMAAGEHYYLKVIQDATGGRTLDYGTAYYFENGTKPVLSTWPNAIDILVFECDGTNMFLVDTSLYQSDTLTPMAFADKLRLWLKADAITGLSDGDSLTTWEDQSDFGSDFTQATVIDKPVYKTNIINGLPAVRFTAADTQWLETVDSADIEFGSAHALYFLTKLNSNTRILFSSTDNYYALYYRSGNDIVYKRTFVASYPSHGYTLGNFGLFEFHVSHSVLELVVDNVSYGINSSISNTNFPIDKLGRHPSGFFWDGDVVEVIGITRDLTIAEKIGMRRYFNDKYNLGFSL